MYKAFDPGIKSTTTEVYANEIPGGQYSNFYEQARRVGVPADEFHVLTERYKEVNDLFGNIVKVTPSSKVVGDMALLLQKNGLTGPKFLKEKPQIDYPDSVVAFFKGHMGIPQGGFVDEVRELVLGQNPPPAEKAPVGPEDSLEIVRNELKGLIGVDLDDRQVLSYRLYPKVFLDASRHYQQFGKVDSLSTSVFFYGLAANEEVEVDVEPGKTLIISLSGVSEANAKGTRTVFFQLNGFPREIEVRDNKVAITTKRLAKADPLSAGHVAAPMPSRVLEVKVKVGDRVNKGDALCATESMKMEYVITAKRAGEIKGISIAKGDQVEEGDLLIELA
jgi:pyruvate carboxylase